MRILLDADACPVVDIAIELAKKYNKEIILYYDDSHQIVKDYAKIIMVSQGPDAVDYSLINDSKQNGRNGILFDDEEKNRKNWKGKAFDERQIMEILNRIASKLICTISA